MEQLSKVEKLYGHALNVSSKQLVKIVEKLCELSERDPKHENGYHLRFDVKKLKDIFLSSNFVMKELEFIPEIIDIICEYCKSINLCWSEKEKSKFMRIIYTNADINGMDVIDKDNANISYAIVGPSQDGFWANSIVTEKPILVQDAYDYGTNNKFFRFIFRLCVNLPKEEYQLCIGIVQKNYKMKLQGKDNSALFGFEQSDESFCFHWNGGGCFYYSGVNVYKRFPDLNWNLQKIEALNDNGNKNNNKVISNDDHDQVNLDGYFMIEVDFENQNMKVVCNGLKNNSIKCDIPQKLFDIIKNDQCFHVGISYVAPSSDKMFVAIGLVQ